MEGAETERNHVREMSPPGLPRSYSGRGRSVRWMEMRSSSNSSYDCGRKSRLETPCSLDVWLRVPVLGNPHSRGKP